MQNAPDLETALTGFVELQQGNSRGASVYLHRYGDTVIFGYGMYERDTVAHVQGYALVAALIFNMVQVLTGGVAQIAEVLFSFRRPSNSKVLLRAIWGPHPFRPAGDRTCATHVGAQRPEFRGLALKN